MLHTMWVLERRELSSSSRLLCFQEVQSDCLRIDWRVFAGAHQIAALCIVAAM
jgi:hypothetical protein